jgi:hypothetical protein
VRYPGDEILGVEGTSFSPASRRMMTRAGSRVSFIDGSKDLDEYASLHVDPKDIERVAETVGEQIAKWMDAQGGAALLHEANGDVPPDAGPPVEKFYVSFDGTGIPMRRDELRHTKGKGPDGRAQTREVKLGCVFTQIAQNEKGLPIRDPDSTTYVGSIVDSNTFGHQIHAEAIRRGMRQAKQVIALTDAIPYNKTVVAQHFPHAIHILDLYHAREHLDEIVKLLGKVQPDEALAARWKRLLDKGLIESLIDQIRVHMPRSGQRRKLIEKQIKYFQDNAELMRYDKFRKQGLFIGSGVIEAGCKTLIGQRLKQSGMFWSVRGANAIIAARCCSYSGRFEQFWEDQSA